MDQLYLLQNQDKLFLTKQNEWCDGRDLGSLFKTRHRDEALNHMVEVNAKDVYQRIHILECPVKSNGFPDIGAEHLPPPTPKPDAPVEGDLLGSADSAEGEPAKESGLEIETQMETEQDAGAAEPPAEPVSAGETGDDDETASEAGNPSASYRVHEL